MRPRPLGPRRRRRAALLLAVAGAVAVVGLTYTPAGAQAPDVAAWWNAANAGDPAPAPPVPPDVKDGDLLVQGSNAAPAAGALGAGPASSQAVAGLAFDLPAGAVVGALTLDIDGNAPPQVSVVACRATSGFFNESNAQWSDVPSYDANTCLPAALKDGKVVVAQVSRLTAGSKLALLLIPGALDRVVLKAPGPNALAVTTASGLGAAAAPFGSDLGAGSAPSGGSAGPAQAPVGAGAAVPPVTLPAAGSTAGAPEAAPVIAAPQSNGAAASSTTSGRAATFGLSTGERRLAAALVIAMELVGFLLLLGDRGLERAASGTGLALAAGGRLRVPDRLARGDAPSARMGGVGRLRAQRSGPVPHL